MGGYPLWQDELKKLYEEEHKKLDKQKVTEDETDDSHTT